MRLIGILSWYDERPDWLAATVASLAKAQVSHLVAVDGRYALYPDSRPSSPGVQHDAIVETCRGAGMGLTMHIPTEPWAGNEVAKRTFCFELAETVEEGIAVDAAAGVYPRWYDEAYLNRYLVDNPAALLLDGSYCAWDYHGDKVPRRIVHLDKTAEEFRLRGLEETAA